MKILKIEPANDGMAEEDAEAFWDDVAGFAAYSFNRSHSVAYSLLSYQTMWLKVYYPAEFFSGLLSCVKTDRRTTILADMQRAGISIIPPDINDSSKIFEPMHGACILMPFNAIKGIGDVPANAIMKARDEPTEFKVIDEDGTVSIVLMKSGRFTSIKDFEDRVNKSKCNVNHRGLLDRVGAFARIESDQLPSTDHTRRRDQVELLEGLIVESVVIDREGLSLDAFTVPRLSEIINTYKNCDRCELAGLCHPRPWINGPARIMLVVDGPNWKEEGADEMGHGSYMESVNLALEGTGLEAKDVYIASMIKSPKPEGKKAWSSKTLNECPHWIDQEIELLKPPVIVLLGTLGFKHFCKDSKGSMNDHVGKVVFDKARDANILVGFSPGQIYFSPEKQEVLNAVFAKIADLLIS